MNVEVKVPEVGESVQEVLLAQWYKRDGDPVEMDQILFIIETDKVTLEVASPARGVLRILVPEGTKVTAGKVVATIDSEAAPAALDEKPAPKREPDEVRSKAPEPVPAEAHEPAEATVSDGVAEAGQQPTPAEEAEPRPVIVPPSVRRLAAEKSIDIAKVAGSGPGGRITQGDVLAYWEKSAAGPAAGPAPDRQEPERQEPERQEPEPAASVPEERIDEAPRPAAARLEEKDHTEVGKVRETPPDGGDQGEATTRKPMSPIRKRIAERLLQARQGTAMVTTFNEIDMSRVQAVRAELKESFKAQYGVSLGIMSFFIKAAVEALKEYPAVNASIDGNEIVYHHYHHIGVAVGGERGLVVPVVRHADRLSFAGIESAIAGFVEKIRENRLELSDLEGGTFTVSNGGIYGSLLSTPILNIPQSAILGMHKIEDRPVAVNGQVVVRPMMYVALSYDHRIIDGREAVSFLKRIKECVENPERIMLEI